MKSHSYRGPGREPQDGRDQFDFVDEGRRYGLSPEVAREIWERVARESTTDGRIDETRAGARFREVARRVAARGGRIRRAPGKVTRVETELLGRPAPLDVFRRGVPGKITRVEMEARRAAAGAPPPPMHGLPFFAEVQGILAGSLLSTATPPQPRGAAAKAAPTGIGLEALDQDALERRALMLGVLPLVTPRWKELGGALFTSADAPGSPHSLEAFTERAFGLILETPADLVPAELALNGPGREPYARALHQALQTAQRDRPVLEKIQADIEYLASGGDVQFAAARIISNHALASAMTKAALQQLGALAADKLAAYAQGDAIKHGIKLKRSELVAQGVDPFYAEAMAMSGGPPRMNAVFALGRALVAGAGVEPTASTGADLDSDAVRDEAVTLGELVTKTVAQKDKNDRLAADLFARLDTALGAASPRARELVWANPEITGMLARALDPSQAKQLLGKLDTIEALYETVKPKQFVDVHAHKLLHGPPLPPPKFEVNNASYPPLCAWLEARPGEANRALRARLLHHAKLKSEVIDRLRSEQQRLIYRLIASGTVAPTAEDTIHEAAEKGRGADLVRALRELASRNPERLAELERDATFRSSIERMRQIVDVDGIPLRPYDVCLTMWGRNPHENVDPLLAAQRQINLTGNHKPLTADERIKLDDELFNPALADLHAQVANTAPKPPSFRMAADISELNRLPRAQAILDRLRRFERQAAQEELKSLLQRDQLIAGVELGKRFGKRWNIDLRTWVYESGGPNIRSGVGRILGTEHGASVGTFNGEAVGLGEALPDKITMQQALRETISGGQRWTISEWCSVESREMSRAIDAKNKQKVLEAWWRLELAIENVKLQLERLTGRPIRAIDLLRNAMMEHGGHLEARIAERFKPEDRDELCEKLGIKAANIADAALAPKKDTAQLADEAFGASAKSLWGCLSALHAGSGVPEYVALGGFLTLTRAMPRLGISGQADASVVEERPPRSFAAYYRAQYGTSVDGHVEAVLRAMPDKQRAVPLDAAARLLGLDPQKLAGHAQASKEELVIDEHNGHLVRAEFTVDQARGRARQIWEILHGSGRLETINKQLYGDCNEEEQRLIRIAFRELSGGFDLTFYIRQAIVEQQRRARGNSALPGLGANMFDPTRNDQRLDVGAMGASGSAGRIHVHGTETELERALSVSTIGEVDIKTRLSAAVGRGNSDHVFRTLEAATQSEKRAILADGALVNRMKRLGQWQWERCFKVLTDQADLADRLYSRSHGDGGFLESTFGGTHEAGMKEDLKGNGTRLRLVYDAEVRAEIANLREKPDPRAIDREINRRVLNAAGINAADPSVEAILTSELDGSELGEMKGMVRNAGTARDWAVASGGGTETILSEIRGMSAEQRQAKLRDAQYLKVLGERLPNEQAYRDALNALEATGDADVAHGGGALARLDAASRDHRKTLRALSELTPEEYQRLLADPKLQLQVMDALPAEERAIAREMLAFRLEQSAAKAAGDEVDNVDDSAPEAATPAEAERVARRRAQFFVHQSVGRLRVACLRSWRDVLVQAAEIYKLDFERGFAQHGEGGHGPMRPAPEGAPSSMPAGLRDELREQIWRESSDAVRAFAKEHQDHPGKKTRDAVTSKEMIDIVQAAVRATRDPSDALVAENIYTVDEKTASMLPEAKLAMGMFGIETSTDETGLADTLRAASDKHVAESWTSIQRPAAGNDGDTMQRRYRELVATETVAKEYLKTKQDPVAATAAIPAGTGDVAEASPSAASAPAHAPEPAMYATSQRVEDPVVRAAKQAQRRFLEYQIKIAQALEDMLLPHMGDDRRRSEAPADGEQQLRGRDNKRYNDLAKIILERIPRLPPEVVGAALGVKKEHLALLAGDARRHAGEVYLRDQRDLRYRGEQNSAGSVAQDEKEILDEEQARLGRHHAQAITDGEVTGAEGAEYDRRYEAVDRAQEAHKTAKEEAAGWAALIVGTVVTIAATVLTGGLATGPVAMMALAGATAALSATAKSMVMEEILEGEWDRKDAARMISTEIITGIVTMGTTYYAQRLLAAAGGAMSLAKQGAAVRQVLRTPPKLYKAIAHEAMEEVVSEVMSGVVEAGLEAADPAHWMHGYEEGAHSAKQAALARLAQVDDNALQGAVTSLLTSVAGRGMNKLRRGGGHYTPDAKLRDPSLDVPAKAKKRVDVVRNLKQTLGDPGEKFMEALIQWGMQQDGPINWGGAPSELLRGWIEEMGEASVEMHTGTVHKAKRDARAKAEIDRAKDTVPTHELDDYQRMQDGALDTDVFVSMGDYQRIREGVILQTLAGTEARGGFQLTPIQRQAFVAWVRTNTTQADQLVINAALDPRMIPEVIDLAEPQPAPVQARPEVPAHERTTAREMPAADLPAHERVTAQMPVADVPAHERATAQIEVVAEPNARTLSGPRDVFAELPELDHLAAALPEMMLGAHQQSRIEPALQKLSDADYQTFQVLLSAEPNLVAQGFLFKALAANNSITQVQWLAAEIAGKDAAWLIDNLTLGDPRQVGGGVKQQWSMSCNASMTITLRGNYDPVFALHLRYRNMGVGDVDVNDPDAMNMYQADLEKQMLESEYGGGGWGAAGSHRGRATPVSGEAAPGRGADDLLNALSEMTGVQYAPRGVASPSDAVPILDAALTAGIQVPVIVGDPASPDPGRRGASHYLLAMARREGSAGVEYQFHDTGTGTTAWVSGSDIAASRMPFGWPSIVGLEAPSVASPPNGPATPGVLPGTAEVRGAPTSGAVTPTDLETEAATSPIATDAAATATTNISSDASSTRQVPMEARHREGVTFVVRSPGEIPEAATPAQRRILEEASARYAALHDDPRFSRKSAELAWAIFLRDHGITVPDIEIVDDVEHDRHEGSDGAIRRELGHPLGLAYARATDPVPASAGSTIIGDAGDREAGQSSEYRDKTRPPNRPSLKVEEAERVLGELIRGGVVPGDVERLGPRELRVRLGAADSTRTLVIELQPPGDLNGHIAQSDVGADAGRVRIWISDRILDEHVSRALGEVIADVIARTSQDAGIDVTTSAQHGGLRAMFARLHSLETAARPPAGGDVHEIAMHDGRAEAVGRVRAELDVMLLRMGLTAPDRSRREAALDHIGDPALRQLIQAYTSAAGTSFDADAAARYAGTRRRPPAAMPADLAVVTGQVPASSVLPPPPIDGIRSFTAADHARVVQLRLHFEVIAELDARLAARDRPGSRRGAESPALGDSVRRREHVAKAKTLLAELQIGGTDPEFIRARLEELTAVFPGTDDIAAAVHERVQRRVTAVDAHQRAEAFRTVRDQRMKELAKLVRDNQPFKTDRVIVGGGMAGTTRAAALDTAVGDTGMVDPASLLMVGGDDMVSQWAPDEYWGQRMGVFGRGGDSTHPMYRGATEGDRLDDVVEDPGEFMHAGELNDSMDLARQRLGLVPLGGRVLHVEVANTRAPWPEVAGIHSDQYPVKVTIDLGGTTLTIYTKHTDITTGLGNTAMPNVGVLAASDRSGMLAMSSAGGAVLRGGERLVEKDAQIAGRVLLVAIGPTAAWAARRAVQLGASRVDWAATGPTGANARDLAATASIDRTQDAFADDRIHRTTDQIMRIDPDGDGALVTFAYPGNEADPRPRSYKVRYHHIVMAQGYDSAGGGAAAARPSENSPVGDNRVGTMLGDMPMRPQSLSEAPILENEGPFAGAVSVIGAAAWDTVNLPEKYEDDMFKRKRKAAARLSSDSPDARTLEALGNAIDESR